MIYSNQYEQKKNIHYARINQLIKINLVLCVLCFFIHRIMDFWHEFSRSADEATKKALEAGIENMEEAIVRFNMVIEAVNKAQKNNQEAMELKKKIKENIYENKILIYRIQKRNGQKYNDKKNHTEAYQILNNFMLESYIEEQKTNKGSLIKEIQCSQRKDRKTPRYDKVMEKIEKDKKLQQLINNNPIIGREFSHLPMLSQLIICDAEQFSIKNYAIYNIINSM